MTDENSNRTPLKVVALIYDGLCTFEYGIVAEIFGLDRPELGGDLYAFTSVAMEKGVIHAAGGLKVQATGKLSDIHTADLIVIPGWRGKDAIVPKHLSDTLCAARESGAKLLSICSGVYVLAAAGLLDNAKATTHWRYAKDLQEKYPLIKVRENDLYIDNGQIITSAGSSAGIDACLHLIRKDYGAKVANSVARRLVMHSHRQGDQAQFIEQPMPKSGTNSRLSEMMENIRADLRTEYTISSLAAIAGMSTRTFQRQFQNFTGMPAMQWLMHERVTRSTELLETTDLSVDSISDEVGFNNVEAMRYHFRQMLNVSPLEYRKRFPSKVA